ncbi:DUF3817 domain-containing protein [Pedobacter aquatilis]|uniref:DUF3817 domain-containing protein n=1 Tax=Pedobacter aquatilis TaxID=351343 RepID=UPI00292E44A5|nr:DUF3817 domain-containing protein [Pedobacter aquatilis]
MINLFNSSLGRLRIISYLEGISLLILLLVAVPLKYYWNNPALVKAIGPVHGALFLWFVFSTFSVAVQQGWKFKDTTWKVLLACLIPLGTFYIDRHILRKLGSKAE